MYIIVVGGGKVGYYLTKTLLGEGHEVLLIERNGDKVDTFTERFGAVVVQGDGAEAAILANAGAARADVVIAVTGEDEDNLVVCQMARQKFHVRRTIARVNNPKNEQLFRLLGIDVTVSQTNYILNIIEQSIPDRSFIHLLSLRHADLAIIEATIAENSPVANRSISEIDLPVDCVIAAIARGPHLIVPTPGTEVQPGDEIIAVTHREQEDELRRLLVA
ncbi:MAG: TrkA-like protein [uncultured Thermomicrobiales bacterium]|uniref:Trk system potassium uptake protein TrkA n=1 Tax=uncultured Thermomicrobiales bacterium TaxID=1645740 RepID=A0A6J4U9B5_9BACT|nr:MAG: TrkA-like protein [uncultured Thermomicrobiales bacterium]